MAQTNYLVKQLKKDHPDLIFRSSNDFCWSPAKKTIYYSSLTSNHHKALLLHELAHALLGHTDFDQDISLLHHEISAWKFAKETLSKNYNVEISEKDADSALESYRNWLSERSKCPDCDNHAPQTKTSTYKCNVCGCQWRANDARLCQLRRYKLR